MLLIFWPKDLKVHLKYTPKSKDLSTILEKSFFSHRLTRLLAPFRLKNNWKIIKKKSKNRHKRAFTWSLKRTPFQLQLCALLSRFLWISADNRPFLKSCRRSLKAMYTWANKSSFICANSDIATSYGCKIWANKIDLFAPCLRDINRHFVWCNCRHAVWRKATCTQVLLLHHRDLGESNPLLGLISSRRLCVIQTDPRRWITLWMILTGELQWSLLEKKRLILGEKI